MALQCAKKPGASAFGASQIGLVNSVRNLPYGLEVKIFGEFKLEKDYNHSCSSPPKFWG